MDTPYQRCRSGPFGTASEPPSSPDTHDSRVLDPVAYDKVRAHSPHRNTHDRRRFGTPSDQPDGAKWAIEDRHENIVIWEDDWGRLWEKGPGGPTQRSDMVHVSVWWQRAEAYTDAYLKETARYVLYRNLDGNMRIRQSLREGVSPSTHFFFGYFPRRGHTDLWFLPKVAPMPSGLCVLNKETAVSGSPPRTPRSEADRGTYLEAIQHAVHQGLDSGRDVHLEGCQIGGGTADQTRTLSEEMENLLSLIEIARLDYSFIATEENAEFESKNGERGAKRASDSSSRPFTTSHGAEVLIRSDRDDHLIRPRANDARYHFGNQVFGEERGNVVFSSTNNGGLVSGLRLVKRHGPPDLSAVSEPHPGAEAEVFGTSQSPRTARLGGAGPASVREAMSHEIAHNIHKAEQGPDLQPQKTSKLGQRRRMYGVQEDSQREELLRNVRRSQIRHGQMQRRYEEGRSPRRRMIPEHDEKKKIVSATGPCLPINPVKGIRGRVRRNRTGRSSLEAGDNLQTWRTEKELGPQQQARTSWKMRQEALAALEGRIQTSAQMNDAKETRVGDQPDDFLRVPSSPGLMMVLAHTRRRITSSGTGL